MRNLPKDWKWVKLEEVCDIISGKNQSKVINENGIYPIYGSSGIFGYANEYLCNEGTTVVGRKGTINSPLYVSTKFWNVDTAFGLSPKDCYHKKLLYYFCLGFNFHKLDKSTTIPSLAKRDLLNIDIPLPPIHVQSTIVSKIEELFSELDNGIENLRLAKQQLKTYRQAVLQWAFEGRLTNKNVKEGELPEGWKITSIGEVASVGTGATPLKSNYEYYGGKIAWVTSGALNEEYVREATDYVTEKAIKETNLTVYPKYTLLVAMYGEGKTRGKCSELLIEACTNQAIAAIHFDNQQVIVKKYLKYFLVKNYIGVRKKSSGGVQPNLNLGIIKKLQFPLAPFDEQSLIVQEIENRLSVADKMEESITQSLQQAEALRQSILKKAFEGKLI